MLNKVKYGLREKIISSTKEGTADISDALNLLQASVDELTRSMDEYKKASKLIERIASDCTFVSAEYLPTTPSPSKKRLLICGFYGAKNLGDELMLQSLLSRIDKKKFDATVMVARHPEVDPSCYSPCRVVHYPKKNDDILNIVHNYDALVWGGGAIIDDMNYGFAGSNTPLGYIFLKSSIAMINAEKPVYILGLSTNQYLKDARFINDLRYVVEGANYFSLRDTNSKKTLEEAGIDTKKVAIINDLVIADIPTGSAQKKSASKLDVGVILLNPWDYVEKYSTLLKNLTTCFADKKVVLHFIPFYDYLDLYVETYKKLAKIIDVECVVEDYPETMEGLAKVLLGCDVVFSMRYHGTLISSLLGVKTVSVDMSSVHPHYYNKLNYIKEKYSASLESLVLDEFGNAEKINKLVASTLKAKTGVDNKKIISSAAKELDLILKDLLGSI